MSIKEISDASFVGDVAESSGLVLIDFWAAWCGPCRAVAPVLEQLAAEDQDLTICKMNIDDNPATPTQFGVRSIPTLMLFKDGKMVGSQVGALPKVALQEWVNRHK